jgi:hypothetical protein
VRSLPSCDNYSVRTAAPWRITPMFLTMNAEGPIALNDGKVAIPAVSCSSLLEDWSVDVAVGHYTNTRIVGPQSRMVCGPQVVSLCTDGSHTCFPWSTFYSSDWHCKGCSHCSGNVCERTNSGA